MTDESNYEADANAAALEDRYRAVKNAAERWRRQEAWRSADAAEREILKARMIEEAVAESGTDARPDAVCRRVADAVLGRCNPSGRWIDGPDPLAGRPFGMAGSTDPETINVLAAPPRDFAAERPWTADGLIPHGRVTLLAAPGDKGKSRLLLQLAASIVLGGVSDSPPTWPPTWRPDAVTDPLGVRVAPPTPPDGPPRVLYVSWEDEREEFSRRMVAAINARGYPGSSARGMAAESFYHDDLRLRIPVLDKHDVRGPLWGPRADGSGHVSTLGELTPAGRSVLVSLSGYSLCVIDPLAAAFASNENDRGIVRAFLSTLDDAARAACCSILLASHPSKVGAGYSGSTDWRNAVRSMLELGSVPTRYCRADGRFPDGTPASGPSGGAKADAPLRIKAPCLQVVKANYAERKTIWLAHRYVPSPDLQLAWFAATEEESASAAAAAAFRERLGSDEPELPAVRQLQNASGRTSGR